MESEVYDDDYDNLTNIQFLNQNNSINFTFDQIIALLGIDPTNIQEDFIRNSTVIIFYSIIVIVSLIGNILVCKVIFGNKSARTKTNLLIGNLSVSDLLMTVLNIPFNIARILLDNWPFGETLCILVPFIQVTSVYVSSFTMIIIALDRYHRLKSFRFGNNICISIRKMVFYIWFLAAAFSLPHGMYNNVVEVFTWKKFIRCRVVYPDPSREFRMCLTLITFVSQYLIPITITCAAYIRIGSFLWKKEAVGSVTHDKRLAMIKRKRRRIKMLIMVVAVFAICWFPLNVYHILTDFDVISYRSSVFFTCHWLAMSSVCYNPFIYCWLNDGFKKKVYKFFGCINRKCTLTHVERHQNITSNIIDLQTYTRRLSLPLFEGSEHTTNVKCATSL